MSAEKPDRSQSEVTQADIENAMAQYSGEGQSDDASGGSAGEEQLQSEAEIGNVDGMPHGPA